MFTKLISALKATRRTIVFTEGPDARILEAADRLIKDDLMDVILIGNVDEVKAAAAKGGFDIATAEIIDPATYAGMDEMVAKMGELRKGKMSEEDCRAALAKGNYFGTMLGKMGKADALLGGATYSTADTVRPALQLVKTKKGAHLVSSSFISTTAIFTIIRIIRCHRGIQLLQIFIQTDQIQFFIRTGSCLRDTQFFICLKEDAYTVHTFSRNIFRCGCTFRTGSQHKYTQAFDIH